VYDSNKKFTKCVLSHVPKGTACSQFSGVKYVLLAVKVRCEVCMLNDGC